MENMEIQINWLKEQHLFVRREGGYLSKDELIHLFIAKKPIRKIITSKLSRKELEMLVKEGKIDFEKRYHTKLIEEKWKFLTIRSNNKIIFYDPKKIVNYSVNDMELEGSETNKFNQTTYYYLYKGKKYLSIDRYDQYFGIHTRSGTKIHPYKFKDEL